MTYANGDVHVGLFKVIAAAVDMVVDCDASVIHTLHTYVH